MGYAPTAPFRCAVDAALLQKQVAVQTAMAERQPETAKSPNKWDILRDLTTARADFALTDRDLTVLQALLSFHPKAELTTGTDSALVIHPSNRSICERLNGMPCSTMRRHLAKLIKAGLLIRRDSANGKRFSRRLMGEKIAYGFDLSPLLCRAEEFHQAAQAERARQDRCAALRADILVMRRDLLSLAEFGTESLPAACSWEAFHDLCTLTARSLRRKLCEADLNTVHCALSEALKQANTALAAALPRPNVDAISQDLNTRDVQNEQHQQKSDKECLDSEQHPESGATKSAQTTLIATAECRETSEKAEELAQNPTVVLAANLPFTLVLETCGELRSYASAPIRGWRDLVTAADTLRPMMGIDRHTWEDAKRKMGPEQAAVTLAAMLERFAEIKNHGGYLRALSAKAQLGKFSCAAMFISLARRSQA